MAEIVSGPEGIARGVERLAAGRLVAFPTETVYGLGASALDADAVKRVFALKGRPSNNPLIVHVSGVEMASGLVQGWSDQAQLVARAFWPGPVTIVLVRNSTVPDAVCAGGETVAVRCPEHPCALALIESFGQPIVGPSANPSGSLSPTTPEHVRDGFAEHDLLVLDGGHCRAGIESSVLDLSGDTPVLLRPGIIGAHRFQEVLGQRVLLRDSHTQSTDAAARSPGIVGAHYQPRTRTRLVTAAEAGEAPRSCVLLSWSAGSHPSGGVLISMPSDLGAFAHCLYRSLHEADAADGEEIWVEKPPRAEGDDEQAIESALLERLGRATQD